MSHGDVRTGVRATRGVAGVRRRATLALLQQHGEAALRFDERGLDAVGVHARFGEEAFDILAVGPHPMVPVGEQRQGRAEGLEGRRLARAGRDEIDGIRASRPRLRRRVAGKFACSSLALAARRSTGQIAEYTSTRCPNRRTRPKRSRNAATNSDSYISDGWNGLR